MPKILTGLNSTLELISRWATAEVMFQLCKAPYLDALRAGGSINQIATKHNLDRELFIELIDALDREGLARHEGDTVKLSQRGEDVCQCAGWLTLYVGGYGPLFRNIDGIVRRTYSGPRRDGRFVATGSCQISQYDSIPLTRRLIERTRPDARMVVDFGCGNAQYLVTFCEQMPGLRAIGVEENADACDEGRKLIATRNLQDRISLVNSSAIHFTPEEEPDFIIFAFVLHELVSQLGESGVETLLRAFRTRCPNTLLLIIEVDDARETNPDIFNTPIGRGYYNYYFMWHPFTNQRLLPDRAWRALFRGAGFEVIESEVASREIDPSGLEIGYVLRPSNKLESIRERQQYASSTGDS